MPVATVYWNPEPDNLVNWCNQSYLEYIKDNKTRDWLQEPVPNPGHSHLDAVQKQRRQSRQQKVAKSSRCQIGGGKKALSRVKCYWQILHWQNKLAGLHKPSVTPIYNCLQLWKPAMLLESKTVHC